MEVEVTTVVDRPVATVWDWYAVHHVENHPRWDPDMEMEQISEGPIGVGTVIKRHVSRFGNTTEGTMEILEFEPEKAMRGHDPGRVHGDQWLGALRSSGREQDEANHRW